MKHSDFTAEVVSEVVCVVDLDQGGKSVTNDAEHVVTDCFRRFGDRLIIYKDSEGYWDQLRHEGPTFTGFGHLGGCTCMAQAITAAIVRGP